MDCSFTLSNGSCIKLIGDFDFNDSFKRFVIENKNVIREITLEEDLVIQKFLDNEYMNKNCFNKIYNFEKFEIKFDGLVNIRKVCDESWNIVIVTTQECINDYKKEKNIDFEYESYFIHGCGNKKDDYNSRLVRRCISTYGYIEHEPNIGYFDYYLKKYIYGEEYIVSSISNGIIPNQKPRCAGNSGSTFITLEPKNGLKNNEKIFWYIDEKSMTINQYEDGYVLQNLKQIIKV